jgi:hypothetical protein
MASQLTLAFTVNVSNSSYGPAKAATALAAVPLYNNPQTDPILGQFFGLTVASDTTTTTGAISATRTIVLNMAPAAGSPVAPPPFPCNPITATPPVPPYSLLTPEELPGNFLTTPGSNVVPTSDGQGPSLVPGNIIQFESQPGVFYTVLSVVGPPATLITIGNNYSGPFAENEGASVMVADPAPIAAIYSTSQFDTNGVAIAPAIPAGSGAQTVQIEYMDSTGAGPFFVTTSLMGTFPSPVTLAAGSKDISKIVAMTPVSLGSFSNTVGQITLCALSAAPPAIPTDATLEEFQALTDEAQGLITRGLVYLPPSYFALSQQGANMPVLSGTFRLVQGNTSVATSTNHTAAIHAGNELEFAAQPGVLYEVQAVGPGTITLTTPYEGGVNSNPVLSSAFLITPTPAQQPTNSQLSTLTGEYVNPGTAPVFVTPTFLSGLFARTLQLAMAVPVVPSTIVVS